MSIDACIRLKDKVRTFFSANPLRCKHCHRGRMYIFDAKLMMDVVDVGECPHCKGTGWMR